MVCKTINELGIFFPNINVNEYDVFTRVFLKMPDMGKEDILEFFEHHILACSFFAPKVDSDVIIPEFFFQNNELTASKKPTYKSEFIAVLGQLFIAGYIDFGITISDEEDDEDFEKIDYPNNLSKYKNDRYKSWIYFRDNYFYKEEAYNRDFINNDIYLYNGKEYNIKNCPKEIVDECEQLLGVSVYSSATSWETPNHWSYKNIWVCITEKGIDYRDNDLKKRVYNKYKDLSVEFDGFGCISKWLGNINR